jgi:AcrR family transcriptional regulator
VVCKNKVLVTQNANLAGADVATRIAHQTLSKRGDEYADEVRRLLDAALSLMASHGTTSRPRVADIVAKAGMSNDAFYRHFPSKDALVRALLDDGSERLIGYLGHQMAKVSSPADKIRCWVEGILSQTDAETAAATLAVMWNGGGVGPTASGRHFASGPMASLIEEPLTELGSTNPSLDASLAAHAVLGKLSDYLWDRTHPSGEDIESILAFCLPT